MSKKNREVLRSLEGMIGFVIILFVLPADRDLLSLILFFAVIGLVALISFAQWRWEREIGSKRQ